MSNELNNGTSLLDSLSTNQYLKTLEKIIGFEELPVPIDIFLHDDYYLGRDCGFDEELGYEKTYKVWRDALNELFPNPITMKSSFICNTGAIGCLSGDTKIKLINGNNIEEHNIEYLYNNRKKFIGKYKVYSYDTINNKANMPGDIINIYYTGIKDTVNVNIFDKNKNEIITIECTPDHKFLTKDGYYKRADSLTAKDILEIEPQITGISSEYSSGRYIKLLEVANVLLNKGQILNGKALIDIQNNLTVESVNEDIERLIDEGYLRYDCPRLIDIDELVESLIYVVSHKMYHIIEKSPRYMMANKLLRPKLPTIEGIIKVAKKLETYKLNILSEYFGTRIDSIVYNNYDTIIDFALACDMVISDNGYRVVNVSKSDEKIKVYDMTVDKYHNYGISLSDDNMLYTHNTGKSNCAKIIILYLLYKMSCCKNFFAVNRLTPREIVIGVSHNNKYQADSVIKDLKDMMNNSPYFTEQLSKSDSFISKYVRFVSCRSPNDFVGTNMPIWFGTELNDYKPQTRALELIDSAISRIDSRFKRSYNMFSCIILDSSDRGVDSAVPIFLKENEYGREAVQFRFSHWEAKPGEYWHKPDPNRIDTNEYLIDSKNNKIKNNNFGKPALSFRVYCGDSEIHPCIIHDGIQQEILDKMDPDRFIDVPNECRNAFENNIELALQEKCGRATESSLQYFNPVYVLPSINLDNKIHRKYSEKIEDVISCAYFNDEDQYYNYLEEAIELIPKNRSCFVSIDLALSSNGDNGSDGGDRAGFAIGYIEDIGQKNDDGIITYDPMYKIPIAFAISRYPGEETNIAKIINLIKWVHSKRYIHTVSTDRFQSYAIEQACLTMNIRHEFLSVDRQMIGWKLMKEAFYRKRIDITQNNILKNEILNVYYDEEKEKVDHHEKLNANGDIGSNSKDILDACVRLVWNMNESLSDEESRDDVLTPKIVTDTEYNALVNEYTETLIKMENIKRFKKSMQQRIGHGF